MQEQHCQECKRAKSELKCHLDVYNDFDDSPGILVCDDCVCAAMEPGPRVVLMPARPEGYYHAPIGTFD